MRTIKRTTIVLDDQDMSTMKELTEIQRCSEMEAIRRSIRLSNKLMTWQRDGGEIVLERGKERTKVVFV